MNYYTLAPVNSPPEVLIANNPRAVTLAAWYRFGSYCPDTVPAFVITYGTLPAFSVDISEALIIVIDPESEIPPAVRALIAIGSYLFDQAADKPIVMDQSIGGAMRSTPHYRLIDFGYEDSSEGKLQLQADCLAATGVDLDRRKSLSVLRDQAWSALKSMMGGV